MNRAYESKKQKLEAHPSNKWTHNQEKTNGSNIKNQKYNYCTMNSPELTQATDEPRIKAPSSLGYLQDQSPDEPRIEAHCIV